MRAGFISRVHGITFDTFKEKFFSPLEHVIYSEHGRRRYDMEYRARHPHIAELVFREVLATSREKYDKLVHILESLNPLYKTDRESLRSIINANTLIELMPDQELVEKLFQLSRNKFSDDGHVALHHGIYEMKRDNGNLAKAEEHIVCAEDLMPGHPIIQHTMGELELRRAEESSTRAMQESHLRSAETSAQQSIGRRSSSTYGYHLAIKCAMFRLDRELNAKDNQGDEETVTESVRNIEKLLVEGLQKFPEDSVLLGAEANLAERLRNSERAIKALERSVENNIRNPHTVSRLSKLYRQEGRNPEAKALLQKSIAEGADQKRLNYLLARILIDEGEEGLLIEKHLGRSFSEGDRNYEAQFWYARQLYINDDIQKAKDQFDKLRDARVPSEVRRYARGVWLYNGHAKTFSGRISRMEQQFSFIERDGAGDAVYLPKSERELVVPTGFAGTYLPSRALNLHAKSDTHCTGRLRTSATRTDQARPTRDGALGGTRGDRVARR